MILGSGHKPQQWARKQTYSHATVKTKGRCWHAERLWIIPSRGSPLPLSTIRSLYTLLCVPLGIQIVQIVCECELSTVFNFGSPQCLVSASLRRAVPCHMQQSLRRPKPQCTLTVPTGGGGGEDPPLLLCVQWERLARLASQQAHKLPGPVTADRECHANAMSPRFSTTRPGLGQTWTGLGSCWHVLLPCKCRKCECTRSRCLRLFNSHTCSISQCNHKFWLNYRIKMFVLNLKMCVRVQHCPAVLNCSQRATGRLTPAPQGCLRCNRWQLIRGARRRRRHRRCPWPQSPYLTSKQGRTLACTYSWVRGEFNR